MIRITIGSPKPPRFPAALALPLVHDAKGISRRERQRRTARSGPQSAASIAGRQASAGPPFGSLRDAADYYAGAGTERLESGADLPPTYLWQRARVQPDAVQHCYRCPNVQPRARYCDNCGALLEGRS